MSAIVTFIGWDDSGKTVLVTKVVDHLLEMGYRVALITARSASEEVVACRAVADHIPAIKGVDSVMTVGPQQIVLQTTNTGLSLRTLAHRYFPDADIVIGDGFENARKISKIEVSCNPDQALRNEVHGVIAVATNLEDIVGDYIFRLDESREIAQFIEKRFLAGKSNQIERAALLINGHKIPVKDFVQETLASTVHGFVSSLKFVDDISEIELRIKVKKD